MRFRDQSDVAVSASTSRQVPGDRGRAPVAGCEQGTASRAAAWRWRRLALVVTVLALLVVGCGGGASLGGATDNEYARGFIGTWDVIWDLGKSWEERATVVVSERNGRLSASGLIDLTVKADGSVTFTDIEGYYHVGQVSDDKRFASGIYTGDWTGPWQAAKR